MRDREATARARRDYDAYAPRYDRETGWYERIMLGDGRSWAGSQAHGVVLEVAVGTGRNLPFYPPDVRLVGLDLSVGMLMRARDRARKLGLAVGLVHGDAQAMPFADAVFDTVVCTLGLSSIPDDRAALAEMHRVLRGGGRLVLLGHVASPHRPVRLLQRVLEHVAATRTADTQRRQTAELLPAAGFTILYRRRSRGGIIERITAATR